MTKKSTLKFKAYAVICENRTEIWGIFLTRKQAREENLNARRMDLDSVIKDCLITVPL